MTDGPKGSEPLIAPSPAFGVSEAARIAERSFGVSGTVSELGGERDQNFRVDTDDGAAFVLKISNPADDPAALDLQTEALRHISDSDPELPVMRTVPTNDGSPWTSIDDADGVTHYVRLFTLVPGRTASPEELDHAALHAYGAVIARVGRALRGFFHSDARYDILWDLRHTPRLRSLLDAVMDDHRRNLAERVLDRFDERVDPEFDNLRAQVIHNDLTLDNVPLDADDRVSGIVDFGDLTHTALVCDLAVALASVMFRRSDPIEAAQAVIAGYVSVTPLEDEERRLLADLVAARLTAWGIIAAWRVKRHPDNAEYITAGEDEAWDLLTALEQMGLDVVGQRLQAAALATNVPYSPADTSDLASRRRRVLGSSPLSYREPVHLVDGAGVWLFDPSGRRYLDAYNNVQVVGHANPKVAAAIAGQARKLATNSRYLHEALVTLAERLVATMPDGLDTALLVNSGSEANDLAWRMATVATGREGAIVSENAYHGITDATTALSPEVWPDEYCPDHVETVPPPVDGSSNTGAAGSVGALSDAVDALEARGTGLAALLFDPLFTSDGIRSPEADELRRMVERVHDSGGLVVADEVQSGHGRTGSHLWGFQASDIVPDIVTLGKPMGNGHPVAAVVARSELVSTLRDRTGIFSTFGGNPVSCVAALAVLDVADDRELLAHTVDVGEYLRAGLERLSVEHDLVGAVRGRGLMLGVELVRDQETWAPATSETTEVVNGLRQRRVLIGSTGRHSNVLKIRPPLVFERSHADHLLGALDAVLTDVES